MACDKCSKATKSNFLKPFKPPGGWKGDLFFECSCGNRFYQYDQHGRGWRKIRGGKEWRRLQSKHKTRKEA